MTDSRPTPLEDPDLAEMPGVRHGFFTKRGGVSEGLYTSLNIGFGSDDNAAAVTENRARTMDSLGLDKTALTTVYQVHGTAVAIAKEPWAHSAAPKADGLVTDRPGVALGIATADCAPVLFADADAGVIGACHAGWKGALGGITDKTLDGMEALGARRERILAVVGPCIAQISYEVGAEFRDAFLAEDPAHADYFAPGVKQDKYQFDLPGFVQDRLARAGVGEARWIGRDTRAEEDLFFSYRRTTLNREKDYGRLLSTIVLQG